MSTLENISLFIPHVFPNFTNEYVANVFKGFGEVNHVDFVAKYDRDGNQFNSVYIHFKHWYDTIENRKFQDNLRRQYSESQVRVYHDNMWYWIVLPNTAKKHLPGERKPRIDLGGEKAINISIPEKPLLKRSEKVVIPTKSISYAGLDNSELDEGYALLEAEDAQMEELEAELNAEDANLITIDGRYVHTIEEENLWLRNEVAHLRAALINLDYLYQIEAAKVRALNVPTVNVIENL